MKTKYKYILLGIVGLLLMALVLIIGLRTLVMSIANQRTCEWANIDNIELNARIDVPLIIDSDCEYLNGKNSNSYALFDKNKGQLWVSIQYTD